MRTMTVPATAAAHATATWRRVLRRSVERLLQWQERAEQRWHLTRMDERMLKDLGISRVDACREANKPFWRG